MHYKTAKFTILCGKIKRPFHFFSSIKRRHFCHIKSEERPKAAQIFEKRETL